MIKLFRNIRKKTPATRQNQQLPKIRHWRNCTRGDWYFDCFTN